MSPLCFANPKTCRTRRCYVHHVTFVQSLFAKSWTKLDMSPKCVCPFSTKTAENNWNFFCTGKAWLIVVTWHQKVQMTKNWTCHLCALNRRYTVHSLLIKTSLMNVIGWCKQFSAYLPIRNCWHFPSTHRQYMHCFVCGALWYCMLHL